MSVFYSKWVGDTETQRQLFVQASMSLADL